MDVVNVDYRQANEAARCGGRGCRCALTGFSSTQRNWLRYQRIVVAGGSAGGHLALHDRKVDEKAGFDDACAFSIGQAPVKSRPLSIFLASPMVRTLQPGRTSAHGD